jgi:hypothetical protein
MQQRADHQIVPGLVAGSRPTTAQHQAAVVAQERRLRDLGRIEAVLDHRRGDLALEQVVRRGRAIDKSARILEVRRLVVVLPRRHEDHEQQPLAEREEHHEREACSLGAARAPLSNTHEPGVDSCQGEGAEQRGGQRPAGGEECGGCERGDVGEGGEQDEA